MSDEARSDGCTAALSGIGVLVTRDVRQASDLTAQLQALGADVFEFPVIEIAKPTSTELLDQSLSMLTSYDWIVFASTNAVDFFTDRMRTLNIPHSNLVKLSVAAIGAKTAERAKMHGLKVDFHPKSARNFSARDFVREFCKVFEPSQKKVLWPRTDVGALNIKELLEEQGASVDAVIAYETVLPEQMMHRKSELQLLIESGKVKVITLTSSQSARNLLHLLKSPHEKGIASKKLTPEELTPKVEQEQKREEGKATPTPVKFPLPGISIAAIGAQTRKTAEQLFACECFQSENATIEGLVKAVVQHSQNLKGS